MRILSTVFTVLGQLLGFERELDLHCAAKATNLSTGSGWLNK